MKDRDVAFLMLDCPDGPDLVREKVLPYLKEGRYTMPCLFRSGQPAPGGAYGIRFCPTQYVIGRDGRIAGRGINGSVPALRRMVERALEPPGGPR